MKRLVMLAAGAAAMAFSMSAANAAECVNG